MRKGKQEIHTTIKESTYNKLLAFSGCNVLNDGIEKAVAIAEGRELQVKLILEEIARGVLNKSAELQA